MPDVRLLSPAAASPELDRWSTVLRCPDCGGELSSQGTWQCTGCGFSARSRKDLRPVKHKSSFQFDVQKVPDPEQALQNISVGLPDLIYDGPTPGRNPRHVFSALAAHCPRGSRLLDLGCGPKDQAAPAAHLGYEYLGADYSHAQADVLVDAHALPFATASFNGVLSYAVFEHLYNPFIAIQEVSRVLQPGGVFVGVVSQGEPYHQSFFHMTAWGIISLAASTPDLSVIQMWPSRDTLLALGKMGGYSKPVKSSLRLLDLFNRSTPFLTPRKMRWPAKLKAIDEVNRAGSIGFVIKKK